MLLPAAVARAGLVEPITAALPNRYSPSVGLARVCWPGSPRCGGRGIDCQSDKDFGLALVAGRAAARGLGGVNLLSCKIYNAVVAAASVYERSGLPSGRLGSSTPVYRTRTSPFSSVSTCGRSRRAITAVLPSANFTTLLAAGTGL